MKRITNDDARRQFAGLYTLIEFAPHRNRPNGRIYYDRAGYMWVMLHPAMNGSPTLHQVSQYSSQYGLVAYYGRYDVKPTANIVIHHVEAASNPAWIGLDFWRAYEFSGDRLTLRTEPASALVLVWQRMRSRL